MSAIPKTMRAVVYRGVNDLRLETVPVPRLGANELLVKVAVCGVCPTDIKKIHYGTVPPPRIFGHETAGTIVRIGAGASALTSRFKIGDRVALHHHVPCLDCHYCRHRAFAQCETYKRTGITAGFEPAGGGYAEYVRVMPFVLPGVVKIPAKNSFAEGALLEPVNTVLKAVRRLHLLRGDTVLVAGQGPIGLMFTRLLQLQGVRVLATDLLASRLRLARKFGAKWTLDVGQASSLSSSSSTHSQKTGTGRMPVLQSGFDAAIVAVPSDAVVQQALQLVRGGGQVLLFAHTKRSSLAHSMGEGGHRPGEGKSALDPRPSPFQLDLASVCLDEKDLLGSYSSDFTLQRDVARLVFSRQLDVRRFITHRFPLEQTAAAVALAARPTEDSLKIIVEADVRRL
ncbi:MAG: alcohol dehydrogenase catalytic domain-containing protein [Verrucomicrobiota bacterium]